MGDVANNLWPEVYERIRAMLDVRTRARPGLDRAFRAESSFGEPDTTWLTDDALIRALESPDVIYVVYSYAIPIGWTDGQHWTIHYSKASKTTRGHVNHLRRALSLLDDDTLTLPGPLSYCNTRSVARRIFRDAYPDQARAGWVSSLHSEFTDESGKLYTMWTWGDRQLPTGRKIPTITMKKGAL